MIYTNICPICKGNINEFINHKIVEELEKNNKSATQLSLSLGMSFPTTIKYLSSLIEKGIVVHLFDEITGGRPSKIYAIKKEI